MNDRDKALFSMLFLTGARVSELLAIRKINVMIEDKYGEKFINIRLKTLKQRGERKNKPRVIPILYRDNTTFLNPFLRYIQLRDEPFERVFKISRVWVWHQAKKYGLGKPHNLRHSFITEKAAEGFTPYEVKEMGGWASTRMIDRYQHAFMKEQLQYAVIKRSREKQMIEKEVKENKAIT